MTDDELFRYLLFMARWPMLIGWAVLISLLAGAAMAGEFGWPTFKSRRLARAYDLAVCFLLVMGGGVSLLMLSLGIFLYGLGER